MITRRGNHWSRTRGRRLPARLRRLAATPEGRYMRRPRYDAVVVDVAKFPYMGFGATSSWLHMAQVAADAVGAPLQFVNPDQWPFGGRQRECALDRFLEIPVTEPSALADKRCAPFIPGDSDNMQRWGFFDELHWPHCAFGYRDGFDDIEAYRRAVLAHHPRPTSFARDEIERRLGFLPPRYAAWHVRRGDKVRGPNREDDPVSVDKYAEATAALLDEVSPRPSHLVICTDSPDVLEEAANSAAVNRLGLEIVFDPAEKRWDGYCELHRTGQIDGTDEMVEETLTAQKIVEILRRADVLVGCNSSYLFRVPALLRPPRAVASLSENKAYRKYFPI